MVTEQAAAGAPSDGADPLIGRVFASRYRLEKRLGEGAMGAVYRARHVKVGRAFAVKILHDRLLEDDTLRRRFQREAELAGKLHHINVVGVVDVGETEDGIHFMVMELAEGPSLGELIAGPMPATRVTSLVQQLLDGLAHAHERGLIHRDFKPDNVIVERDRNGVERPRIVDFGIAILREEASAPGRADRLTSAGLVLGTPHYMAPEHATGDAVDHRIDLFALGVLCYELLTGVLPFDGDGADVARANLLMPTPPMSERAPEVQVDPLLEAFTRRLMEKHPARRPATARHARALLDLIARDRESAAAALGLLPTRQGLLPTEPMQPASSTASSTAGSTAPAPVGVPAPSDERVHTTEQVARPRRRPRALAVGAALVLGILVIAVLWLSDRDVARPRAPRATAAPPASNARELAATAPVRSPAPAAVPDLRPAAAVEPQVAPSVEQPAATGPPAPSEPANAVSAPGTTPGVRTRSRPAPHAAPSPAEPVESPTPPVAAATFPEVSSAELARLYAEVGRELAALDRERSADAGSILWQRYRRIRINDALASPAKRAEVHAELSRLRALLAALR